MSGCWVHKEQVLATMKSGETEGWFELYVTRTPGYLWALLFRRLRVHPIVVTLLSMILGALSGYFLTNDDRFMRWIGVFLLVWSNWYDCADGQLARLTGQKTLLGRILDGFAGDVWFFSIYFFICLRLTATWGVWIWLLATYSGCHAHARQCALADYYRNIHLFFLLGREGCELDTSGCLREQQQRLAWNRTTWFQKVYLFFYIRYTEGQERMTPAFQCLYKECRKGLSEKRLAWTREHFLSFSRPLMKYCNLLTFDLRAGVLFVSALTGVPWVFFIFEAVVLEGLRHYVCCVHERNSFRLLREGREHE